ncbi:hypothetical protein vseg_017445 [Gypsophila vaccaria]
MNATNSCIEFDVTVTRQTPELIRPTKATPYEYKQLSDVDSVKSLRFHAPIIEFYKKNHNIDSCFFNGLDPCMVIKDAIAKALVAYYPLAGRLRETPEGTPLVVECTGEGVLFIDARVDATLDDFGRVFHRSFPCPENFLCDIHGFNGMFDCPLLLIQVTRLKCGGFIFALQINHTICDGVGLGKFLNAVSELARGAQHLSVLPVWDRHLLRAPNAVQARLESVEQRSSKGAIFPLEDMVHKVFLFGPTEIANLHKRVQASSQKNATTTPTTSFELITSHLWQSYAMAMYNDPKETTQLWFPVNIRSIHKPPLPTGYYGNALAFPMAQASVGELFDKPIRRVLELVKEAKQRVTQKYVKTFISNVDGGGVVPRCDSLIVSDHRRLEFSCLDFGWGPPIFGGYMRGRYNNQMGFLTRLTSIKCSREIGVLVPICLPSLAMKKFVKLVGLV